jgi:FdhD protein
MVEKGPVSGRGLSRLDPAGGWQSATDQVAVEEPLEIRVAGEPLLVTMRTPGHDTELALGWLLAEGVIRSAADVGRVSHCGRIGDPARNNVIDVLPGPGVALDVEPVRRTLVAHSACGVCGRQSIEALLERVTPLPAGPVLPMARLFEAARLLEQHQEGFRQSGGLHAAALFDAAGAMLCVREDVGRHNAVDKVLGRVRILDSGARPIEAAAEPALLLVSGRVSFEIVHKAVVGRVPIVAGVSAPTSLAVDLAARTGLTLLGFLREQRANVYTGLERVQDVPIG